jgi:hypothetical protein
MAAHLALELAFTYGWRKSEWLGLRMRQLRATYYKARCGNHEEPRRKGGRDDGEGRGASTASGGGEEPRQLRANARERKTCEGLPKGVAEPVRSSCSRRFRLQRLCAHYDWWRAGKCNHGDGRMEKPQACFAYAIVSSLDQRDAMGKLELGRAENSPVSAP